MIEYRSIDDLTSLISKKLHLFPHDLELIIGVPRSGLLPANILSLFLNIPLATLDSKGQIIYIKSGNRTKNLNKTKKILVVDDSIHSGQALSNVKKHLGDLVNSCIFCVIYAHEKSQNLVDIHLENVSVPRVFQWNLFHHSHCKTFCWDIDGVLCRDPTDDENDDGEKYIKFIESVPPRYTPSYPLGWIVSSRLEKYRAETEGWLLKHKIKYEKLILLNLPSKSARIKANNRGGFKAAHYKNTNANLFIESSHRQSVEIAQIAGKMVYCTDTGSMIYPGATSIVKRKANSLVKLIKTRLIKKLQLNG
jgi:orotate phosphoribosyltransferase